MLRVVSEEPEFVILYIINITIICGAILISLVASFIQEMTLSMVTALMFPDSVTPSWSVVEPEFSSFVSSFNVVSMML